MINSLIFNSVMGTGGTFAATGYCDFGQYAFQSIEFSAGEDKDASIPLNRRIARGEWNSKEVLAF